jgi:hypothetical protein
MSVCLRIRRILSARRIVGGISQHIDGFDQCSMARRQPAAFRAEGPMRGRHPVGKDFLTCLADLVGSAMCLAFLLGVNTDGLHAIRKISSLSLTRARSAMGRMGFAVLGGRPLTA